MGFLDMNWVSDVWSLQKNEVQDIKNMEQKQT